MKGVRLVFTKELNEYSRVNGRLIVTIKGVDKDSNKLYGFIEYIYSNGDIKLYLDSDNTERDDFRLFVWFKDEYFKIKDFCLECAYEKGDL